MNFLNGLILSYDQIIQEKKNETCSFTAWRK